MVCVWWLRDKVAGSLQVDISSWWVYIRWVLLPQHSVKCPSWLWGGLSLCVLGCAFLDLVFLILLSYAPAWVFSFAQFIGDVLLGMSKLAFVCACFVLYSWSLFACTQQIQSFCISKWRCEKWSPRVRNSLEDVVLYTLEQTWPACSPRPSHHFIFKWLNVSFSKNTPPRSAFLVWQLA